MKRAGLIVTNSELVAIRAGCMGCPGRAVALAVNFVQERCASGLPKMNEWEDGRCSLRAMGAADLSVVASSELRQLCTDAVIRLASPQSP